MISQLLCFTPTYLIVKALLILMETDLENISNEPSRSKLTYRISVNRIYFIVRKQSRATEHQNKKQKEKIKVCILAFGGKRNIINIFSEVSVFPG